MKQLVEYKLESGGTILVEVELPESAIERAGAGDTIRKARETFDAALAQIRPMTEALMATLRDLSPDEVDVEFGIKLGASSGVVIASADVEANFKVNLHWKQG